MDIYNFTDVQADTQVDIQADIRSSVRDSANKYIFSQNAGYSVEMSVCRRVDVKVS